MGNQTAQTWPLNVPFAFVLPQPKQCRQNQLAVTYGISISNNTYGVCTPFYEQQYGESPMLLLLACVIP